MSPEHLERYGRLFRGRSDAWGTGKGAVIRGELTEAHYASHLAGEPPGLGIFPLLDDGTCYFAAVDLDEPDLEAAKQIRELLPPSTWIERSRSGNYHVWAFFESAIDAWIPRGLMREVCKAVGKPRAEIFPKQDRLLPGMIGNYINLPYHGDERPILSRPGAVSPLPVTHFLGIENPDIVTSIPGRWHTRAIRLGIKPQEIVEREREQGSRADLHGCATYIIQGVTSGDRPLLEGHRHIVLFNLAKMLLDWKYFTDDEAWEKLCEVNLSSPDPIRAGELRRIFDNAKRGGYTSTGCDDPVMTPYTHPQCPIARQT